MRADTKSASFDGTLLMSPIVRMSKKGQEYAEFSFRVNDKSHTLVKVMAFKDIGNVRNMKPGQRMQIAGDYDAKDLTLFLKRYHKHEDRKDQEVNLYGSEENARKRTQEIIEARRAAGFEYVKGYGFMPIDSLMQDNGVWVTKLDYVCDKLGADVVNKVFREKFSTKSNNNSVVKNLINLQDFTKVRDRLLQEAYLVEDF